MDLTFTSPLAFGPPPPGVQLGILLLVIAGLAALTITRWRRARRNGTARGSLAQVVGVLLLCPVGAELILAYDGTAGDPGALAFAVVFFAALYGAPALLGRELARRLGWGWPSMLLLFAALGTAQACLIDQAMFSADYQGYEGWEATREATLIPALGISGLNVLNFVGGHIIFSFAAPIALTEAWSPRRAEASWLSPVGIVVLAGAYALAAVVIVNDPESQSGSPAQLAVSGVVVAACIAAAAVVGQRRRQNAGGAAAGIGRRSPVLPVAAVAVTAVLVPAFFEEGWTGVGVYVVMYAALGGAIVATARRGGWTPWHAAAVATACLAVRGLLAFTYFPLIGDVTPVAKYTQNVVMLAVVVAAAAPAWIRRHEISVSTPTNAAPAEAVPSDRG